MGNTSRGRLTFTVEVDAPEDLAVDAARADALLTVRARPAGEAPDRPGDEKAGHGPRHAEVLIMDRSQSMAASGKLDEAKKAVSAAIDTLRDGTLLGIVAGDHEATVIYPPPGRPLAPVDQHVRQHAKHQVAAQVAQGGTRIGRWLTLARDLFDTSTGSDTVCHAVLYTDGKNEHETPEQLANAVRGCADRFTCDARGLGEHWHRTAIRTVTEGLHGSAAAVLDIPDLTEDFVRLMQDAQQLVIPRMYLALSLTDRFDLGFVRQTRPVQVDLTDKRQERGAEIHIPLGAWAAGAHQYHVSVHFEPESLPLNHRVQAATITLRTEPAAGQADRPTCTDERVLVVKRRSNKAFAIPVSANLTRVEAERELRFAMQDCADAHERGDSALADAKLRQALALAEQLGDTRRLRLLHAMAQDGPDGKPVVRTGVSNGQIQQIGLDATHTGPVPDDPVDADTGPRRDTGVCPNCQGPLVAPDAKFCEPCGARIGPEGAG
ncbi:VWA domain-containing protein [Streptomyces sp. NBC_01016]|uniref:VWA domain-containing protein n=1 Tax=Streptomyces sp. NBC_01016 TaxID=2903720 RepID=UPI002251E8A7|nr:VWA domain-containing protein [Streptomyces sp. NBC_01016]MCX4835493.1 VWA domain-containing protein [Streptomyces sp. NBC_01016]